VTAYLRNPVQPPNPRLQRTRSALLRSPLSSKPLGRLKVLARLLVVGSLPALSLLTACRSGTPSGSSELWRPGTLKVTEGDWGAMKGASTFGLWARSEQLKQLLCDEISRGAPTLLLIQRDMYGRLDISFQSGENKWGCTHCDPAMAGVGMPKFHAFARVAVQDGCERIASFEWNEMGDSEPDLARHIATQFLRAFTKENGS